ncbi:hypothetical protein [Shewanella colwelliana]
MTVQRDIDAVEQLIWWLEDNIGTESTIHFDNEGKVDSATALAALTRLLPHYPNQPFTERYLTVAVSTAHLNRYDEMTFTEELNNPHGRIAKRGSGYFLKLWETLENAQSLLSELPVGSERLLFQMRYPPQFLSCLCGSELIICVLSHVNNFLSCLCGSEPTTTSQTDTDSFLSCLCGSEPVVAVVTVRT